MLFNLFFIEILSCSRNNLASDKIEANRVRNGDQTESRKNSGKSSRNSNRDWGGGQEPGQGKGVREKLNKCDTSRLTK
ncbi:hypothetical protein WR25_24516 [Diploscapter pachys]|uniref:Uncharacterized protein n=1 Tax=Diploscapter pachys TaxID=2018661 RepID=A0A2A2L7L8_9BILA|nr:hypothetical protein WR25_24516 [Diploscapter pachys]